MSRIEKDIKKIVEILRNNPDENKVEEARLIFLKFGIDCGIDKNLHQKANNKYSFVRCC